MNFPIEGSIEQLLYDATDGDALLITHRIEDAKDGYQKKYEALPELTE